MALLSEAGANGGALLLHHGSLVGNRLRGAHIPNELLHCTLLASAYTGTRDLGVQEVIVVASGTPPGRRFGCQSDSSLQVSEASGSTSRDVV